MISESLSSFSRASWRDISSFSAASMIMPRVPRIGICRVCAKVLAASSSRRAVVLCL